MSVRYLVPMYGRAYMYIRVYKRDPRQNPGHNFAVCMMGSL